MTTSVTVYCSSSSQCPKEYFDAAAELGKGLAERAITLVFGGGNVGLMGCIANAVMRNGGAVKGIMPRFLEEREIAHSGITELHIVDTMHERKMMLAEWADAFIVLPGGFGTLDELVEVLTWRQLGHHCKPIILFNIAGFWDPLLQFFDTLAGQKLVKPDHENLYQVCSSIDEIFGIIC
ncbi:MAG: TIGR00730 family Rossman fold protein [Prosthecochloris sp.]|nr:TIGR00730 family Rossman fold protein [Prosthecochloris sp.]